MGGVVNEACFPFVAMFISNNFCVNTFMRNMHTYFCSSFNINKKNYNNI